MRRIALSISWIITASSMAALAACGGTQESAQVNEADQASQETSGQSGAQGEDPGEPVKGDWVIGRLPAEPAHLNVLLDTGDAYGAQLTRFTFESMTQYNRKTLEEEPLLAKSWEVSDDHLTYTFELDEAAHFSDGEPVTAEDVKFTFETIMNPEHETADLRNYYQSVEEVEIIDDHTIRFHCSKPYFKHLTMIGGMPVYPAHVYGEGDFNKHPNNRKPVGSGPYEFHSWDTNQQIVFARDDDYWNKDGGYPGYVDRMVHKIVVNDDAAFQVLVKQDIDYMGLTPEQWVNRTQSPEFEANFNKHTYWATSGYVGGYSYIAWNLRKPMFQDARVRQALTMLLDRELMLEKIWYDLGKVVSGIAHWQTEAYDQSIDPWPYDPERAKEQLTEAGWVDSNGDGIRDKDGQEFSFQFYMPSGSHEVEQMATVYKEELERAGIEMEIRKTEWATFIDFLTQRKFDAVTLSWAIPVDQDPYQVWHSSQTERGSNYPGYVNEEVDQLLEEARSEFDEDERNAMYREMHNILHEDQPYTFLFSRQRLVAVADRIQGVNVYPMGLYQDEWWVPKAMQQYGQ